MKQVSYILRKIINTKPMSPLKLILRKSRDCRFEYVLKENINRIRNNKEKCIVILATPCHGNLGDHAIVYAEYSMIYECGYKNNIIEISNSQYMRYKEIIRKYINNEDVIIVDGGGNLGTLWPTEDDKIREIIDTYKENRIIVFPQTCFYDDSEEGKRRLIKNQETYIKAKNLTITLRDKSSYDFFCNNFKKVNTKFLPDIVLSIEKNNSKKREEQCLLCFRNDIEKVVSDEKIKDILNYLQFNDIKAKQISTIYPSNIQMNARELRLKEMWDIISGSKLLLTDRLHGMLFAVITGTPCLALDNKSKKVSGVYEWVSKLKYVKICNSVNEMIEMIPEFYNKEFIYDSSILANEFNELKKLLIEN